MKQILFGGLIWLLFHSSNGVCLSSHFSPIVTHHHLYYGQSFTYPIYFVPKEIMYHPSSGVKVSWHEATQGLHFTTTKSGVYGVQILHPNGQWIHLHISVYPPELKSLAKSLQMLCLRGNTLSTTFNAEQSITLQGFIYQLKDWIYYGELIKTHIGQISTRVQLYEATRYLLHNYIRQWLREHSYHHIDPSFIDHNLVLTGKLSSMQTKQSIESALGIFFPEVDTSSVAIQTVEKNQLRLALEFVELHQGHAQELGIQVEQPIVLHPYSHLVATLHALVKTGKATIISRPNIIARYNTPAHLHIGGEIPYEVKTRHRLNLEWKKYGIVLAVTPYETPTHEVRLQFKLTVSYPTPTPTTASHLPAFNTRSVESEISVPLGQTAILSGMSQLLTHDNSTQTPLIGHVPILGHLLQSTSTKHKQTELVIAITPKSYSQQESNRRIQQLSAYPHEL